MKSLNGKKHPEFEITKKCHFSYSLPVLIELHLTFYKIVIIKEVKFGSVFCDNILYFLIFLHTFQNYYFVRLCMLC